jgi:prophage antirepressor-like protein
MRQTANNLPSTFNGLIDTYHYAICYGNKDLIDGVVETFERTYRVTPPKWTLIEESDGAFIPSDGFNLFDYNGHEVRISFDKAGDPWWVAVDVCNALGIKNSRDALNRLDIDEKNTVGISDGIRGNPNINVINEPGLYSLILRSNKPEAKKFKRWVVHEVLPTIRKTGGYSDKPAKETPPTPPVDFNAVKTQFIEAKELALACGLDERAAIMKANDAVMQNTGVNVLETMNPSLLKPAPQQIANRNAPARMGGVNPLPGGSRVEDFIRQNYRQNAKGMVKMLTFYDDYHRWCILRKIQPKTKQAFNKAVTGLGYKKAQAKVGGTYPMFYFGLEAV